MKSVLVITPCVPNGLPTQSSLIAQRLRDAGVRVRVFPTAATGVGRVYQVVTRVCWLVRAYDAVLVDVFGERAFVYESIAILAARLWRTRVIAVLRNSMLPDFVRRWPHWTQFILARVNVVISPHRFLQTQLADDGIRIDQVIPNFIDLEKYSFRQRSSLQPKFLYLRGMFPIYNPAMALQAFALVQRLYPEASITMAGREGPESARCRQLVTELQINNVHFRGMVPKDEIPALADQHDIHIHTNRLDNMPVTIIEMWACGLPIVATGVGGVPYLVRSGMDGLLVPSEDHEALARACLELISNGALAERLSTKGRARAEQLSWPRVHPLWERALFERRVPRLRSGASSETEGRAGSRTTRPFSAAPMARPSNRPHGSV